MYIQTEQTPNPATLKFLPGRAVLANGTADFPNADSAGPSPLAKRLFEVPGVAGVFLGSDFVTVTKAEDQDWLALKPLVLHALMEHFVSGPRDSVPGGLMFIRSPYHPPVTSTFMKRKP